MNRICVVGLGRVGLPTACMFANSGHSVVGVDVNPAMVVAINEKSVDTVEPRLKQLMKSAVEAGTFEAITEPVIADVFIITVPTPIDATKKPDMSHVKSAIESICRVIKRGDLVILESTSPVGTTKDLIARTIVTATGLLPGTDVYVAYCAERVMPGQIVDEMISNDRVIGGLNTESAEKAREVYRAFSRGNITLTDSKSAELVKLSENAFRDVNIAFANELSIICAGFGIDVWEVISLANRHPRVNILRPGPGVGGHCIPVDPWFLVDSAPQSTTLIKTARTVNDNKTRFVINQIKDAAQAIENPVIGCLGLAYKSDADDFRESPALEIALEIERLALGELLVCEPHADYVCGLALAEMSHVLHQCDILIFLVGHSEFRCINPEDLEGKIVIDPIGLFSSRTDDLRGLSQVDPADGVH